MTRCAGITGFIFGHLFEDRYDVGEPTYKPHPLPMPSEIEAMRLSRPRKYKGDVCIRCGEVRLQPDA